MHTVDSAAYYATAVSYARKMFMKLTIDVITAKVSPLL
jgi:hypothetical protein